VRGTAQGEFVIFCLFVGQAFLPAAYGRQECLPHIKKSRPRSVRATSALKQPIELLVDLPLDQIARGVLRE
jgi:hypothetical protein